MCFASKYIIQVAIMKVVRDRNKRNNVERALRMIILALSMYRIALFIRMPFCIIGYTVYDDYYQVSMAANLINGNWLGEYNYTTLIKGISFPLFLAFSNVLSIPYPFLLGLFFCLSSGLFCCVIYKICRSQIFSMIVYLLLIYSPVGFTWDITGRIYRNAIIYPSVLICLSAMLMTYLNRNKEIKQQILWLVLDGVAVLFFYYIREDSIWILPLFVSELFICSIWILLFSHYLKREKVYRCTILTIPVIILLLGSMQYMKINEHYYGVFTANDRVSGSFADMAGNMIKIADESNSVDYWLSKGKLEKIIDACPSLKENKTAIMNDIDMWESSGGSTKGDMTVWGIRIALNNLGYYSSAVNIDEFCKQVNDELLLAVDNGVLAFDDKIYFSKQCCGVSIKEIMGYMIESAKNVWYVATFRDAVPFGNESSGSYENIRFMESLACVNSIHPSTYNNEKELFEYNGWIIWKDNSTDDISISVVDNSSGSELGVDLNQRKDVEDAFREYMPALNSGFNIISETKLEQNSIFRIYSGGKVVKEVPFTDYDDEIITVHFDNNGVHFDNNGADKDINSIYSTKVVNIAKFMINAGRIGSFVLVPASTLLVVYFLVCFLKLKKWDNFEPMIILLGIILTMMIYETGITIFNGWLGIIWFYSGGIVPLAYAVEFIAIAYVIKGYSSGEIFCLKTKSKDTSGL